MKILIYFFGIMLLLSSCKNKTQKLPDAASINEAPQTNSNVITMATTDWPPYYSSQLTNGGPVVEVTREALRRAGYKLVIKWIPWARAVFKTNEGDFHALLGCFNNSDRAKTMIFSEPIGRSEFFLVSYKDRNIRYKTFKDLSPYLIATLRGYKVNYEFDNAKYLTKKEVGTIKQGLGMLQKKRVDLIYEDKLVLINEARRWYPGLLDKIEYLKPALASKDVYIGFSKKIKGIQKIVKKFNFKIIEMKKDGTYKKIYNSHGY